MQRCYRVVRAESDVARALKINQEFVYIIAASNYKKRTRATSILIVSIPFVVTRQETETMNRRRERVCTLIAALLSNARIFIIAMFIGCYAAATILIISSHILSGKKYSTSLFFHNIYIYIYILCISLCISTIDICSWFNLNLTINVLVRVSHTRVTRRLNGTNTSKIYKEIFGFSGNVLPLLARDRDSDAPTRVIYLRRETSGTLVGAHDLNARSAKTVFRGDGQGAAGTV